MADGGTMTFDDDEDTLTLADGQTVYVAFGIIGIDVQGNLSAGYDQKLFDDEFSVEDRRAIADMMIKRWTQYRGRQGTPPHG